MMLPFKYIAQYMTVFLFVLLPEIPEDGNWGRADIHIFTFCPINFLSSQLYSRTVCEHECMNIVPFPQLSIIHVGRKILEF